MGRRDRTAVALDENGNRNIGIEVLAGIRSHHLVRLAAQQERHVGTESCASPSATTQSGKRPC